MCKQILGVKKFTNNIKVLSELERTPLNPYCLVVTKRSHILISKDLHLLKQGDTYSKPSKKKNVDAKGWVQNFKTLLDKLG